MKRLVLASALCLVALPAAAERFTKLNGQSLVGICTGRDQTRAEQCISYIDGVADTVGFYQRLRPQDGSKGAPLPGYLCIPENTTGIQLRDRVIAWFRQHPDTATRQSGGVVVDALYNTFPCGQP